jgi:LacI family transcriptional regulator
MAQRVLAQNPQPTALFAGNNFIAFGAMKALREAGLSMPEDISLVAFDDLPPTLMLEPFLTVAAQPAYDMGRLATRLLVDRLNGQAPQECQEILLETEIVVRRSIGPARED